MEGVALPVYRGLGGQESLVAPGGEEELLTVCSPDEPYLQAHQDILASPRPFQGPNYGPVSKKYPQMGKFLSGMTILKKLLFPKKVGMKKVKSFLGNLLLVKKDSRDG